MPLDAKPPLTLFQWRRAIDETDRSLRLKGRDQGCDDGAIVDLPVCRKPQRPMHAPRNSRFDVPYGLRQQHVAFDTVTCQGCRKPVQARRFGAVKGKREGWARREPEIAP